MNVLKLILRYLNYFFKSKSKHSVHSPFVYELVTKVINSKSVNYDLHDIEKLRADLCKNDNWIQITDLGAGSSINNVKKRKIKDIAKNSAKSKKYGKLLYRLANFLNVKNCIELGTSLGISSSYLARANKDLVVYTLEGCPNTAKEAKKSHEYLKIDNVNITVGDFNDNLIPTLKKIKSLDFAFIDGNHQEEPTIKYFEECLKFCHEKSVFVFDDIHWSKGMENAWTYIKNHPKVFVTIDLFFVGLVFLNSKQEKEHFTIKF